MQEGDHRIGYFLLGFVVLVWGANFGIVKSAYRDLPPIHFAALRFTVSGILLLIVTYWKEKGVRIRKEDLGKVMIVGALGLGFYQILWSLGLNLTSASNSALILSTQPLLGALYVDLIKKESVGKRQYWNMLLALAGVVLIILKPTAKFYFSLNTLFGDLLTLVAGICSVIFFSAWSKPLLKIYSPLRLMSYCMIIGSFILWIAALSSVQQVAWDQIGEKAWWSMGYAVVCSGMMGHVLWYEGIERIGVTKALVYTYFMPLCAILFNYFCMGEKIYSQQVLGGVLILLSVHRVLRS
jgi:drug/metabolite transporter (DMT)-like permease